jgi:hypothetical protein
MPKALVQVPLGDRTPTIAPGVDACFNDVRAAAASLDFNRSGRWCRIMRAVGLALMVL